MASSIDRVRQSIRERLEELEAERDQLMRALEALSAPGTASVGGRRGRPPGSTATRSSSSGAAKSDKRAAGRRAPRGQRRDQVIATLQGGELGPSAIARAIGDVNPTQISGLLRQLASQGVVERSAEGKWRLAGAAPEQPQQEAATAESAEQQAGANGAGPYEGNEFRS